MTDSQGELGGPYPKELLKFQNGRAYGEWGYAGMDGGNVYSFRGALVSAGQSYYLSPEKEGIQLVCRSCKGVMSITYNKVN
jgi:hypothetical protein